MPIAWFKSGDVDEFADSIVAELRRRFPSSGIEPGKKAGVRIQKTHRALFSRIEAFARTADLNLYRKARLGNRVRWALADAGYPKPFVEAFTHELVAVVALAQKGRPKVGR
jgi:hypothetical protein